jgi:aspartate ammonia-lyase
MNWSGHLVNPAFDDPALSAAEAVRGGAEGVGGGTEGATGGAEGVLYGEQTAQALENFPLLGPRLCDRPELVRAVVAVKIAAAHANLRLKELDEPRARAIVEAGQEVLAGQHLDQFVLPVVQGGGGTSTNMNVNEVLAARAAQLVKGSPIHPNDHVNRGQSTNDVMPTAISVAVVPLVRTTVAALRTTADALENKATQYAGLLHLGRTCLQDAVPMPVADLHRSQAMSIYSAANELETTGENLLAVPLGGTAVGTGLGAAPGFAEHALKELATLTGLNLTASPSPAYALASLEPLTAVTDAMNRCGRVLARIATDLRLLSSGPTGGIGEIELPAVQAGSSIMPGKVNPVIPELVMQTSFLLAGAAAAAHSATQAGELEVSPMAPVVTLGLLDGLENLRRASTVFTTKCITGLRWREDVAKRNLEGSLEHAVRTATEVGYDLAAQQTKPTPGT